MCKKGILKKGKRGFNELHEDIGPTTQFLKEGTRAFLRNWAKNNGYKIVSEYEI